MSILYIDLNTTVVEDYASGGRNSRYGGGRCFSTNYYPTNPNFYIAARSICFENMEDKSRTIILSVEQIDKILAGDDLNNHIDLSSFDILIHHHASTYVNTGNSKIKTIVWSVGTLERIDFRNTNICFYNIEDQQPVFQGVHNIYDITIGVPIPPFQPFSRQNYLFTCSRHVPMFNTNWLADVCNKYKIKCYFAGPIDTGYDLLNHIDNQNTFYLGEISESIKQVYLNHASGYLAVHSHFNTPFNLGVIAALAKGVPILHNGTGFFNKIMTEKNGVHIQSLRKFEDLMPILGGLSQKDCYDSVQDYSVEKMIASFERVFDKVLKS